MATQTQQSQKTEQKKAETGQKKAGKEQKTEGFSGLLKTTEKDIKPFQEFFNKFNNDWVMNLASGLAFNILTALFPIAIAIIAITGFVIGGLNPGAQTQLINGINGIFSSSLSSNKENILAPALLSLSRNAGWLGILAILTAIFGGSRLFVTLEGYFDVIYHTRPRGVIKQNIMSFIMMLVFIVLVPVMIFAASGPALVFSLLQATPLARLPYVNLLFGVGGFFTGVLCAWIFFLAIYIVVPNQHISFRNSWLGALVAAVLVQIYLTLFPFYVTHFMNNYTGSAGAAGFAVILLLFLYYFSVILLLGAEINAYFAEKVRATPASIPAMIHQLTSHLSTSEEEVQKQAAATHRDEEPKDILPEDEAQHLKTEAQKGEKTDKAEDKKEGEDKKQMAREEPQPTGRLVKGEKKRSPARHLVVVEAVAGTALAFLVQLFRLRRKKYS